MKGTITIEGTENGLHIKGGVFLKHGAERYEIIRALTRSLGIDTADAWAELVCYCLSRLDDKTCTLEHTEIKIPFMKEKQNETDAL